MHPLHLLIIEASTIAFVCWALSLLTHEHSWVDRIWSIAPIIYLWSVASEARLHNLRLNVMAVLVTLWGARLTFNFARKGGYSGEEDYRWEILRNSMNKWQFQLFNFFFISIYQNLLILLITLPALNAYDHQAHKFGTLDIFFALGFLILLLGETIADQQQWDFHQRKNALRESGSNQVLTFLQGGLFKYSRHPNYFFEQAQWWTLYFIGAVAAAKPILLTIAGPVLLTLLFVGSTSFTEKISLGKYPEYAEYKRTTSAVVPLPRRG